LEFAHNIKRHGFPVSQIEIDDLWERHYGDFTFDTAKFPNATELVAELHKLGYRATLWVYPFVNTDSVVYNESRPFLVQTKAGSPAKVTWWDGNAGIVDFSYYKASDWYVQRLRKLQYETK